MPFIDGELFTCGLHEGERLSDVARAHPEYLAWMLNNKRELMLDESDEEFITECFKVMLPIPSAAALVRVEDVEVIEGVIEDTAPNFLTIFDKDRRERPKIDWTEEQLAALDQIDVWQERGGPFFALTGPAGTGKSTLMQEVVARLFHARLTAMTGKAALRLSEVAERDASTLHRILYYPPAPGEDPKFTRLRDPETDLIVVDEASMMSPMIVADLKGWVKRGVRFLLVGDPYQLPPVITGADAREHGDDYSIFAHVKGAELTKVMRNAGGVLRAATIVRETGEICTESYPDDTGGYDFVRTRNPLEYAVDAYCNDRDDHILITWRNSIRMKANHSIRARFGHGGELPDAGEPVLFKKNGQGVLNGEIAECGGFETGPMVGSLRTLWMTTAMGQRILVSFDGGDRDKGGEFFDGQLPWIEDFRKYHIDLRQKALPDPIPVTFGYCLTAHSAQGSQARRATVFLASGDEKMSVFRKPTTLPDGSTAPFSSRFIYTALTRAKLKSTMVLGL